MPARPFVDQAVGDVDAARVLAERVARSLALPRPVLLRVGMNALFRAGGVVVRVGRPSAPPRLAIDLADHLRDRGISAPRPAASEVFIEGELTATCWVLLVDNGDPIDWRTVGAIVRRVHALTPGDLPDGYPTPPPTAFPWWDFETLMADVGGEIDARARAGLEKSIARNSAWSRLDGDHVVCHGDLHPGNVVMAADGPVLIDWDLMCIAPAGWDHAMLLTLAERWGGDPSAYPAFAAGYGVSMADDVTTQRFAELRNVAATLMRVRAGRTDPAARTEAERRLRFWRGEQAAPTWHSQ
ncbi:MAG TPA: aminoglycoside phosphotransferase family protein [Ilumatobacter sp.]|nr:aminoglycoside phosphotransferase family protein [Ilumatobacter sp.]